MHLPPLWFIVRVPRRGCTESTRSHQVRVVLVPPPSSLRAAEMWRKLIFACLSRRARARFPQAREHDLVLVATVKKKPFCFVVRSQTMSRLHQRAVAGVLTTRMTQTTSCKPAHRKMHRAASLVLTRSGMGLGVCGRGGGEEGLECMGVCGGLANAYSSCMFALCVSCWLYSRLLVVGPLLVLRVCAHG